MNINNQPTEAMTGNIFPAGQKRQAVTRPLPEYADPPYLVTVSPKSLTPPPPPASQPRFRLRKRWFWIGISVLILLTLLVFGFPRLFQYQVDATTATANTNLPTLPTLPTLVPTTASIPSQTIQVPSSMAPTTLRTFQVGTHPILSLNAHGGNVSVYAANTGTITVNLHQHNSTDLMTGNQLEASQDGDHLMLMSNPDTNHLDYDITAPASTQVQVQVHDGSLTMSGVSGADLTTVNGSIDISNISGPVQARTTNGNITLNTVQGATSVDDQNGSLRLSGITGSLHAVTTSGDVVVRSSHLEGQSFLKTQNGSVRLTASLSPTGSYQLETTSGDIDLTFPSTTAFQLDAQTNSGSVRNAFGSNRVGAAPRARVSASIVNGSVIVKMADLT